MQKDTSSPANEPPAAPHRVAWLLRAVAGGILAGVLVALAGRIDGFGPAVLYVASWVILPHVFLGVHVFVRHLRAVSPVQNLLDVIAFVLLFCAILSFRTTTLWAAWFAGVFAVAILKYVLTLRSDLPKALHAYAREKILLETPAVFLFALAALVVHRVPEAPLLARAIEVAMLVCAALFAFWMIVMRRVYHRVAHAGDETP